MIKLINKVVPILALLFVILIGLIIVPGMIDDVGDTTSNLYGSASSDPTPPVSDVPKDEPEEPIIKETAFSEESVGNQLAQLVSTHGLGINGFTPTGNGYYTMHLYGKMSTLESFLQDFGSSVMKPVIGDFTIKESSTYFYLMNSYLEDGTPVLYSGSFYDLVIPENTSIMSQMKEMAEAGSTNDYYLVLTFFVNPPDTDGTE